MLDRGDSSATCRAAHAQRHDLPLEPPGVRRLSTADPHLRVENRVLPAGPTVVDTLANGAFYYGLLRTLVEQDRPLWSQMSFSAAHDNFETGARRGIEAQLYWPGLGEVPVTELVLRRLLPLAYEGLDRVGRRPGDQRPAARRHRAALHDAPERRGVAGAHVPSHRRTQAAAGSP